MAVIGRIDFHFLLQGSTHLIHTFQFSATPAPQTEEVKMRYLFYLLVAYGIPFSVQYIAGPNAALHWFKNPYVCLGVGTFLFLVFASVGGKKKE